LVEEGVEIEGKKDKEQGEENWGKLIQLFFSYLNKIELHLANRKT
jgi:hypothetical protein